MSENKLEKEMTDKKEVTEVKNVVDLLLSLDADKVKMPSITHTMFCKKLGIDVSFECRAVEPEFFDELQTSGLKIEKGSLKDLDNFKMKSNVILASCNLFKDDKLLKHFNSPTPKELLRRMLLAGEINELYDKICELNGYRDDNKKDKEIEEKIKN
ncbi:hypothetical protein SI856_003802 [Clostridioides difficile]|nr:hypothetical protein [Clostridioides difficile]HBE9455784.1 hypothetical protein [Clostridioides difficile]HBF7727245.1 hypothetical protein [Clostridioides difficile]HCQ5572421.1 hypothetical protein [Clostridioides difficile]